MGEQIDILRPFGRVLAEALEFVSRRRGTTMAVYGTAPLSVRRAFAELRT